MLSNVISKKIMKKIEMEDWELKEIGSMVVELLTKGRSVEISYDSAEGGYFAATSEELCAVNSNLIEALGEMVDDVREEKGEPTRAQELAALVENDLEFSKVGMVSGKCVCGSDSPLVIKRQIFLRASWKTPNVYYSGDLNQLPAHSLKGLEVPLMKGEIGTCPNCKRNYNFTNHV
jgi:hypothetical protein